MLQRVVRAFAEEADSEPALGEFLQILGWSVPTGNQHMGASPVPLPFKVKVTGNRSYRVKPSNRVSGLNDKTFVEAAELQGFLVDRASTVTGQDISPAELAGCLVQLLQVAQHRFADISSNDVVELTVDVPKRPAKVKVGDVVAIPADGEGYHLAVVVARDNWGVAVGLLKGVHSTPRMGSADQYEARHVPLYPGESLIKDGTWPIVGHDEDLLALFPDPPELYFGAKNDFGDDNGEYGAAGTVAGAKRFISKEEAERVGLLNGTYQQFYFGEQFQQKLNAGHFDKGLTPGFWR
jgi:hypothetical protein